MELQAINMMILDNYKLIIEYHTGEIKFIDLKDIIFAHDCWEELRDETIFKQAFIDEFDDAPCWPNHNLDMDPIEVYFLGETINKLTNDITIKDLNNSLNNINIQK